MKLRVLFMSLMLSGIVISGQAQNKNTVITWSFEDLDNYINTPSKKLRLINFWATWCAPCIKELPYFEELSINQSSTIEVLLVSLDFSDLLEEKVIPFIEKREITANTVLLADEDYNVWVDKIDPSWSGALPGTLFVSSSGEKLFFEQEFEREELYDAIKKFKENSK